MGAKQKSHEVRVFITQAFMASAVLIADCRLRTSCPDRQEEYAKKRAFLSTGGAYGRYTQGFSPNKVTGYGNINYLIFPEKVSASRAPQPEEEQQEEAVLTRPASTQDSTFCSSFRSL
jgi:hypothetical protein